MPQKIADQRDIDFVLYEQLGVEKLLRFKRYQDFNKKMFDMIIKEAKNLSVKEIFPTYTECDKEGVRFENGKVLVPDCLKRAHSLIVEEEWGALTESPEYGGQGLPFTISQAVQEYLIAGNYVLMTYPMLSHGAGKMIEVFGTEKIKDLFLRKLYTGVWSGTMLLTESDAGSNVGALTTTAEKLEDGTYSITGNKIFITNGEQNLTENIIHPVLARIEGSPAGTKGISIFLVPKVWVNEDGSLGENNDVICTGVEKKMGLHGSPTCSISLGSKGKCRGLLLGKPNQGMEIMFHMMNEIRLEVGAQAFASASCAYLAALDYAKQRFQGRSLEAMSDHGAPQVAIINHPDVKRMLIKMKAYVEGMRSLIYFIAYCFDLIESGTPENMGDKVLDEQEFKKQKEHYQNLVEILTPVVKAYPSEKGFDVCVDAMQIFGGYGYTKEYIVEQLVRDCKIASIYEGTNGIQAMDFLSRKLSGNNGLMLESLVFEIKKCINNATKIDRLEKYAAKIDDITKKFSETCRKSVQAVNSSEFKSAFASAHPLLEAAGDVIMAWMLLWRASVAVKKIDSKEKDFYKGKLSVLKFFTETILPVTGGKLDAVVSENNAALDIDEKSF